MSLLSDPNRVDGVRDCILGGGLSSLYPFLGAARRAPCAYVHTLAFQLSFASYPSFSWRDYVLPTAILRLFLALAALRSLSYSSFKPFSGISTFPPCTRRSRLSCLCTLRGALLHREEFQ